MEPVGEMARREGDSRTIEQLSESYEVSEIDESYDLFAAGLASGGDAATGWKLVLTALLQSPEVLFY